MKPPPFAYHRPRTVQEALDLAGTLENAKLLAGGQTLMPMLNFRFVLPDHVVDLNEIPQLQGIEEAGGKLHIGAMARQRDIERHPAVVARAPLIPEAYQFVSHRQIRNRGTLGGSLCHLDPASEQPCMLVAQGAQLVVRNRERERRVDIADWTLTYMTPALEPDEILVRIECDTWPAGHGWCFTEYARRQGDYAIVGVAALATCDGSRKLTRVAVALCGIAPGPVRLSQMEATALGRTAGGEVIEEFALAAAQQEAMADAHVSQDYRQHLAGVLTRRALQGAFARMAPR